MKTRALLLLWIGCSSGCDEQAEGKKADDPNESRCRVLCDEDDCGAETQECVDECVVQSRGLDALCVQCLVEESYLHASRRIDAETVCHFDASSGWYVCDEGALECIPDDDGECEDAAPTCELSYGDLSDCSDFCR